MQVTERDIRLLSWIGEQLVINKCELAELVALDALKHGLQVGQHVTNGLMGRWQAAAWVQSFHHLQRGKHLYLSKRGLREVGLNFKAVTPGRSAFTYLSHHDAVNRLRLYLEREAWLAGQTWVWISERRLMQMEKAQVGAMWFDHKQHRPDAVIRLDEKTDVAIEVERSYKRPKRLETILGEYLYQSQYAQVRYYYSNTQIYLNLERTLQSLLEATPLMGAPTLAAKIQVCALPFHDPT